MLLGAGLCGAGRAHAAAPGSGGRGRSALGCARCLRERGGGAVPCIAGFQSVGVEVRAAAARVEWCAAWWGASTIVEAARAGAGGGVEGAGVQRMQRTDVCSAMCWWALLSTGGVYRRLSASCDTG